MKKVMVGFAVFLGVMVICTLVSKSVYAYRLPMVSTCQPEAKYIEHKVEARGTQRSLEFFVSLTFNFVQNIGFRTKNSSEKL